MDLIRSLVPIAIVAGTGLIAWGSQKQRVKDLETRIDKLEKYTEKLERDREEQKDLFLDLRVRLASIETTLKMLTEKR